jgi:hypothetical protein
MADVDKQNDDHRKQCNTLSDHRISSLIDQINEQLVCTILFCYVKNILGITNHPQLDIR